jgi:simple sugar transport system permease protein
MSSSASTWTRFKGDSNEGVLALVLLGLIVVMTLRNPDFLSFSTLFSVIRSSLVPTVLALGVLMVIISGGIDVSFTAIAIFAAYTSVVLVGQSDPGAVTLLVITCAIGALLGLVNGVVIAKLRLPTLIVTLGTGGIFKGVLVAYVGAKYIADLPSQINTLGNANLLSIPSGGEVANLHVLVVPVVALCVLVWWLLSHTMWGRSLYAYGGDAEAARRAGFPVVRSLVLLYASVGVLAAIAGLMHITLSRNANPQDLVGSELDIIAAVVLGGASIFGGRGSVLGTVLGVLLIQVIQNSLILVGIPSVWQRTAVGLLLVVGVSVQAISAKRASRKVFAYADEEAVA